MNRNELKDLRIVAVEVIARHGLIRPDWKSALSVAAEHEAEVRMLETQALMDLARKLTIH